MADNISPHEQNKILEAIKREKAQMRPRWYFVVRTILVAVALVLVFLLILFTISFIVFALQENGGFFAINFGLTGWAVFFQALPWSILLLSFALILVLFVLLQRYAFIYHQPSLYVLLLLIVAIVLGSFLVDNSNLHRMVEDNRIPVIENVYQYETTPENYIYSGKVIELVSNGFVLQNTFAQTTTFIVAPSTTLDLGLFTIGTFVKIFGQPDFAASRTIYMYGIELAH